MEPVILDINKMSDSENLYNSSPRAGLLYIVYAMVFLLVISIGVTCFLKVDEGIKGSGVLRSFNAEGVCLKDDFQNNETNTNKINEHLDKKFYVEFYVNGYNIEDIRKGQEVRFEIVAYPANRYGYSKGFVESITKDMILDEETGASYYIIKVRCDTIFEKGKKIKNIVFKDGMPCKGSIIVGKKTVIKYILDKIKE
ncbi:MAG: hypothetical protein J6Y29_03990 [Clostridiales bacterium]|nr:hypothetical protein [Clostridiales bacterium]